MKNLRAVLTALFFIVPLIVYAQWQAPQHSIPLGQGAGVTGFGSVAPGTVGLPLVSNGASADPSFQLMPGTVPLGTVLDYTGTTISDSHFVFAYGQAISRATYATYFALVGTTFGNGDGSTTFNIPDLRGRIGVGQDNMGGVAAGRIGTGLVTDGGTVNGQTLGSAGGSQSHVQTTLELVQHGHGITDTHTHGLPQSNAGTSFSGSVAYFTNSNGTLLFSSNVTQSSTVGSGGGGSISINNTGSGNAMALLQPTIILTKIIRVQ